MDPNVAPAQEPWRTLAERLRDKLLQKPRHVLGTVPEAEALLGACDTVITENTGLQLRITCLVDRELHPEAKFGLDAGAVARIGAACAKYSVPVSGSPPLRTRIRVCELGPGPLAPDDRQRLSKLKPVRAVDLVGWYVDTKTLKVWSNRRFDRERGHLQTLELPYLDEAYFDPTQAAAEEVEINRAFAEAEQASAPELRSGLPWVTIGLLVVFAACFGLEHLYALDAGEKSLGLSVSTLIAVGGVSRSLLARGEWWRLFTAPLLHADIFHLLFNGVAFGMVSLFLEQLLGRAWLLALFAVGALGGSLMSVAWQVDTVSVGASGAIMALFAGAMVTSLRLPNGQQRTQVQIQLARVLIPSLLPAASAATEGKIDLAAHFGGTVTGALLGIGILFAWRRTPHGLPLMNVARGLALLGVLAFGACIAEAAVHYRGWASALTIADSADIDALDKAIDTGPDTATAAADAFVARFPGDPRGHLLHAMLLARQDQEEDGAKELTGVLAHPQAMQMLFTPALEARVRATLAAMLVDLDRKDEAKAVVAPVCAGKEKALDLVKQFNLCPP